MGNAARSIVECRCGALGFGKRSTGAGGPDNEQERATKLDEVLVVFLSVYDGVEMRHISSSFGDTRKLTFVIGRRLVREVKLTLSNAASKDAQCTAVLSAFEMQPLMSLLRALEVITVGVRVVLSFDRFDPRHVLRTSSRPSHRLVCPSVLFSLFRRVLSCVSAGAYVASQTYNVESATEAQIPSTASTLAMRAPRRSLISTMTATWTS